MKKVVSLLLVMAVLFGSALADYELVDTLEFLDFAGMQDDELYKTLDKNTFGLFGLLAADKFSYDKKYKFELEREGYFLMSVGTSLEDNRLYWLLLNHNTGMYRFGYIDLDNGLLYTEEKEFEKDDAIAGKFGVKTDHGYVYNQFDFAEITKEQANKR